MSSTTGSHRSTGSVSPARSSKGCSPTSAPSTSPRAITSYIWRSRRRRVADAHTRLPVNTRGFSLLEALVALAILAVIVVAVVGPYTLFVRAGAANTDEIRAALLAEETLTGKLPAALRPYSPSRFAL